MKLVVGYIPEHFSTPLFFAEKHGFYAKHGVDVEFKPFPSGSGHLIQSLSEGEITAAVGLTEAFIRGIAAGADHYRLVGTYVQSPLQWAVSTGTERELKSEDELQGRVCGVSRMGSGSDVMSRVLQQQKGWSADFRYEVCNTFANLRAAVNGGTADFFMWEYFTSKKYYDNGEIKQIGEIYTPWPSWVVVANRELVGEHADLLKKFTAAINDGIQYFEAHPDEAVEYIAAHFDYSEADARAWLQTVKFSADAGTVDPAIVENTVAILQKAVELPADCAQREYVAKLQ